MKFLPLVPKFTLRKRGYRLKLEHFCGMTCRALLMFIRNGVIVVNCESNCERCGEHECNVS